MPITKFKLSLFGLVMCVLNSLPMATAASYDKYFDVGQDAFLPFQVKAFDSTEVNWYLNHIGDTSYLIPLDSSLDVDRRIGVLKKVSVNNTISLQWKPQVPDSFCPSPTIHLTEESGIDQDGYVKLALHTSSICFSAGAPWPADYTALRGYPHRITTVNGDQIEVLTIIIGINGGPWATYYFGYGVGVVAALSFSAFLEAPSFFPISLPPPKAEGTVVEYVNTADFPNTPGGHYFYTADPAEQSVVDAGGAGKFVRTGRSFASGGFVPVCRFYGSMSPGPNSHFFTVSDTECNTLKSMQVSPTPATSQQWNYEGAGMYSVAPVNNAQGESQCMSGTVPVYRVYNNAYPKSGGKNPWDSNHRFSTQSADIEEMVAKGWVAEGIALCAPVPIP